MNKIYTNLIDSSKSNFPLRKKIKRETKATVEIDLQISFLNLVISVQTSLLRGQIVLTR